MTAPGIPSAPVASRSLTDRGALVLAGAVGVGSWRGWPAPLWLGVLLVVVALLVRRPSILVMGACLLAAALGGRAMDGMDPVVPAPYSGPVTLVADPSDTPYGVRVDVRVDGRRLELDAGGSAAGTVGRALAGERLDVSGRVRPPPPDAPWLVPRHVVGRLTVDRAEAADGGAAPWRAANRFRRLLGRGSASMSEPSRSLYGGFVLGDDRGQSPEVIDDFRGAGLTHLLVVSGQNVAFLLVLASPFTNRLGLLGRWGATLGVIGVFAVLTRFEPSVLRASAMAALAVTSTLAGRPMATLRTLSLAVTALVLVDPLLVRSVGFQLSVAASLGIAVLGPPIVGRLRGPRWWREALGVTLAAQLGVAPVLVPRFGAMPVVSILANVLTVPVAGFVTTWGLPAGVVAGLGGPGVARVVHLPTELMIGWVAGVARVASSVPLGELGPSGLSVAAASGTALIWLARHRPRERGMRLVAGAMLFIVLVAPGLRLRSPPIEARPVEDVRVVRAEGLTVLVLDRTGSVVRLLEGLRRSGVRRIDLLVTPTEPAPATMLALRHRWTVGATLVVDEQVSRQWILGGLLISADADGQVTVAVGDRPGDGR